MIAAALTRDQQHALVVAAVWVVLLFDGLFVGLAVLGRLTHEAFRDVVREPRHKAVQVLGPRARPFDQGEV